VVAVRACDTCHRLALPSEKQDEPDSRDDVDEPGKPLIAVAERRRLILKYTAEGNGTDEIASGTRCLHIGCAMQRESIGTYIVQAWGSSGVADAACTVLLGLGAVEERRAARHERMR
jgi:hypothetical protein